MSDKKYNAVIAAPIGIIGIKIQDGNLQFIDYPGSKVKLKEPDNELAVKVVQQLQAYFDNPLHEFELPCKMTGTDFQQRAWKSLKKIKAGQTLTYSELASKLNSGARAIGGACRNNPIPIIYPCHRVVSKTGIGGYDGDWGEGKVDIKYWLLKHEGVI
ncbi:MAG: methylated-DNA--[protein]-cysteine S-methyltransferase [Gammaproteobacteria bacterium]|nr:methylated-DNA--[protein]-cysteine S-methyltransferase [Gammaproteobacteria bacterium]